jgi:glutamate-1-semialdehyde 2,1-aminomutase
MSIHEPEVAAWPVPHAKSRRCYERASQVLLGGVVGQGRSADPFPLYMQRADGAHIEDVDGNRYVDFHCGFGSVLLGHNDRRLRATMIDTLDNHGVSFAAAHPLEAELAERLVDAIPSAERVVFGCTGSEVTYHAIRLSRAQTGRRRIVKFEGNYHGWHDYVSFSVHFDPAAAGPASAPIPIPETTGMDPAAGDDVLTCSYNDAEHLAAIFAAHGDEIAAVIVEPVFHNGGVIAPVEGFLEACRDLCTAHGSVLIFDEVITGFRQALGGAQAIFGVTPDLTTMGKGIANGVPISVLAGRRDLMEGLSPLGSTFFSGTFNGHLLNVAIANRCCQILASEPPYDHLSLLGATLREGIEAAIQETGIAARVQQFGSVWSLYFTGDPVTSYRDIARFSLDKNDPMQSAYQRFMLTRGFYIHPHYMIRGYLTEAHTVEQIERAVAATREFFVANAGELQAGAR